MQFSYRAASIWTVRSRSNRWNESSCVELSGAAEGEKNANGSSQEQQSLIESYSQNPPLTTASN